MIPQPNPNHVTSPEVMEATTNIMADCFAAGSAITFGDFTAKLSAATGIAWTQKMVIDYDLLNKISFQTRKSMLSTCVVGNDGLPRSGFFKCAKEIWLLNAKAGTREMMEFWLTMYNQSAKAVTRLETQTG